MLVDIVADEHNDDAYILNNLENDKVVHLGSDTQLAPKINPVRRLTAKVISPGQNVTGGIE